MRGFPFLVILVAAVGCSQPEAPSQGLDGTWTLEAAHRALEPATLTLSQLGAKVSGSATVPGLDPVGGGLPVVSVAGSFSSPAASLEIETATGYAVHLTATSDGVGHLVGVLTFSGALGGGSDTVAYVRH